MTHDEMVKSIVDGIRQGRILAVVRNGELRLFTDKHIPEHLSPEEAQHAISAEEYERLSNLDYHAREN